MTEYPYAEPRVVDDLQDCWFYHTMLIPGYGLVNGQWDLRGAEHRYTGGVDLRGKRVLEVGTASGQLCFYMESKGAEVVSYDLSDEQDWDIVPLASKDFESEAADRRKHIRQLNNGYWLSHRAFESKAKVVYGTVYTIPAEIGPVDVATYGSILLHCRDPFQALSNGLRLTRSTVVVTDLLNPCRAVGTTRVPEALGVGAGGTNGRERLSQRSTQLMSLTRKAVKRVRSGDGAQVTSYLRRYWRPTDLRGMPVMEFVPEFRHGGPLDSWWYLTPEIVQQFIGVLGLLSATLDDDGDDALRGDVVGTRRDGRAGGVHAVGRNHSAVTSATAERAEDSSTMAFLAA